MGNEGKWRAERKTRRNRKKRIFVEEQARQHVERPTVYLVKGPDGLWIPAPRDTTIRAPWID